jgi:hypothetical protein
MTNRTPVRDRLGALGESERFIVPMKPGNAGGGTGPQFKTNAIRSEGPGDWVIARLTISAVEGAAAVVGRWALLGQGRRDPVTQEWVRLLRSTGRAPADRPGDGLGRV